MTKTNEAIAERRENGKRVKVDVRSIRENHNPRNPLGGGLVGAGFTLFDGGDKDLWVMATGQGGEWKPAEFCSALEEHDPEFVSWATTFLTVGQLEPVEVRDNGSKKGGVATATLIFGARRCLAVLYNWCKLGGKGVPWVEAQFSPKANQTTLLHRSIVENTRRDPNPMERARAIQMCVNQHQSIKEIAAVYGCCEQTIKNTLALLELPIELQKRVEAGTLKPTKARAMMEAGKGGGESSNGRKKRETAVPRPWREAVEPITVLLAPHKEWLDRPDAAVDELDETLNIELTRAQARALFALAGSLEPADGDSGE